MESEWDAGMEDMDPDADQDMIMARRGTAKPWLPRSLKNLFGVGAKRPLKAVRKTFDHETLLMELLAAEYDDEPLDDGEKEGSDDDFDG
jgi:hypothetical protein